MTHLRKKSKWQKFTDRLPERTAYLLFFALIGIGIYSNSLSLIAITFGGFLFVLKGINDDLVNRY